MDCVAAGRRLCDIASTLSQIGGRLEAGESVPPETVDLAVAQLKGLRVRTFGRRPPGTDSARTRLREYLVQNVGQELPGEELSEIAGISEWARRMRELRSEGLRISQPTAGTYRLDALP
jgi:biotin operon repressor